MFNNEMMADVHFVVGPPGRTQRVPGHKVRPARCLGFPEERLDLQENGTGPAEGQTLQDWTLQVTCSFRTSRSTYWTENTAGPAE